MILKFYVFAVIVFMCVSFSACNHDDKAKPRAGVNDLGENKNSLNNIFELNKSGKNVGGKSSVIDEDEDKDEGGTGGSKEGKETELPEDKGESGSDLDKTGGVIDKREVITTTDNGGSGGDKNPPEETQNTRKVSGSIEGLEGEVTITIDGSEETFNKDKKNFLFEVDENAEIDIKIKSKDSAKACFVSNPENVAQADRESDISGITIKCVARKTIEQFIAEYSSSDLTNCFTLTTWGKSNINLASYTDEIKVIDCRRMTVWDMSGMGLFINLEELYLSSYEIGTFKFGSLTKLRILETGQVESMGTALGDVNLSSNIDLEVVHFSSSYLLSVNTSTLKKLRELRVYGSNNTDLDLTNNAALRVVSLGVSKQEFEELSQNIQVASKLTSLRIHYHEIPDFQLSSFPSLSYLGILNSGNQGSPTVNLDLQGNTNIKSLEFMSIYFPDGHLDVTNFGSLNNVRITGTNLKALDLSQMQVGTALVMMIWLEYDDLDLGSANPDLEYVILPQAGSASMMKRIPAHTAQYEYDPNKVIIAGSLVDDNNDVTVSLRGNSKTMDSNQDYFSFYIDKSSVFDLAVTSNDATKTCFAHNTPAFTGQSIVNIQVECMPVDATISDMHAKFNNSFTEHLFNSALKVVAASSQQNLSITSGSPISVDTDEGLVFFVNVEWLTIIDQPLTSIDVSGLRKLEFLNLNGSSLSSINLGSHTGITILRLDGTNISELDISHLTSLEELDLRHADQLTKDKLKLPPQTIPRLVLDSHLQ